VPDRDQHFQSRDDILRLWYQEHYSTTSATANGSVFERYMHRAMETPFSPSERYERILEVGGNRGEHVPYIRHAFDTYVLSDLFLPDVTQAVDLDPRVRAEAADVQDLPYEDGEFDRLIATCLLHHVPDPFAALHEMRRVVKPGGRITILLPADPGLGYRTAQRVTSGRSARRQGIGEFFELVHSLDHLNHFASIARQIDYVFRRDDLDTDWRPLRVPSWNLNLFTVKQIRRVAVDG
jgi:phosphatidylethanolamine/phosphatidyl-N-methylethanolamine N-methyltransferase